ncbi:MAG: hypothetical protein IKC59_03290 [Clostridia bacterium]|nr:hypothetical protein [Clostridia bacterium]
MNKHAKTLSAMLALLLLFSVTFLFASCGDDDGKTESGTTGNATTDNTLPSLEIKDLGDLELKVLWPELHSDGHYLHNEIAVEEAAGDILNEAVATRNYVVEAAYGVTITSETKFVSHIPTEFRTEAMGGTSVYHALASTIKFMTPIAIEGLLSDLNELDYYDEDHPWWNHSLMQDFSIANARYFATGDIIYSDDFYPYCTYVNTAGSAQQQITEDYFQLVRDKEWTLEKFHTIAASVANDLDGDDNVHVSGEMDGALMNSNFYRAVYYSAGKGMVEFNREGYPVWQMELDRTQTILEKALAVVYNDGACTDTGLLEGYHVDHEMNRFNSNQTLFLVEELIFSERISKSDNAKDYKILPFPLYDSNSEYISVLNDAVILSIPGVHTEEMKNDVCLVLSAMSRESVNTLTPAFFETVLTARYMKDPESVEMLQIVLNSTVAPDVATIQDWGGMMSEFKLLGERNSTNFSSVYETNIGKAMAKVEEYCVMLDNYYAKKAS